MSKQEIIQGRRRSPVGMTADPCPLCKKAAGEKYDDGTSVPFRDKGSICSHCKMEIQDLRNTTRRLERLVSERGIKDSRSRRIYPLPHPFHGKHDTREAISKAFRTLCMLMGGDSDENEWYRTGNHVADKEGWLFDQANMAATFYRSLTDEEHTALQALFDAVRGNNESAYEEGLRRGKDILLSLQSGDIGLSEFEQEE